MASLIAENHAYLLSGNSYSYFGARYYNSTLSIWLSVDPMADSLPGLSPYNYCKKNPIKYVDKFGLLPWPVLSNYNGFHRTHKNNFGDRRGKKGAFRRHKGLDINFSGGGNTDLGAPIIATHSGIIAKIAKIDDGDKNAGGNRVVIQSDDGTVQTSYMHLQTIAEGLKIGDPVTEGQQIGSMGGSGHGKPNAYKSHLHYELRIDGKPVNPVNNDGTLIDPQMFIDGFPGNTLPVFVVPSHQVTGIIIKDVEP